MPDGSPLILGQNNQSANTTMVTRGPGGADFTPALIFNNPTGENGGNQCLIAFSNDEAIVGQSFKTDGVVGVGLSNGVHGFSTNGTGVTGQSENGNGVVGLSNIGGTGVTGFSLEARGVFGESSENVGVFGQCDSGTNGAGIVGVGSRDSGLAGIFFGPVIVAGSFLVFGGAKNVAVRHRDGSYRALYSMESPECWFEDFGTGKLVRGKAKIRLNRDFVSVIRAGSYHVFLTPEGNSNGLYVAGKSKAGFQVREQQNGKNNVQFSYRVVARRKDIPGTRFAKVKLSKLSQLSKGKTGLDRTRYKPLDYTLRHKSLI